MCKKEFSSSSMPKLIISVTLIVMLGTLFGAVEYLVTHRAQTNIPTVNPPVKSEVVVSTNKTEYEIGEPVKITIANHQDEPIYTSPYDSFPSTYFISKFESDKWKRISQNCGCEYTCENGFLMSCPQYVPPAPYFREFKSPFTGEWKQIQCASKNQLCGDKPYTAVIDEQVGSSKYKINFCYWDKRDIDLAKEVDYAPQDKKKCIEKEFAIKEKSASISDDICKEVCGDGVCNEIVCMAVGCPCPETAETCQEDCK